jgi:hypothetical protein
VSRLKRLQTHFQDYILGGDPAFLGEIASGRGATVAVRAAIYADAYRLRLIEALNANFPVLAAIVGVEPFTELARAYIGEHASRYTNIRRYGDELPRYLSTVRPWVERPWLGEMAAFEWAMLGAFDAAEAPILGIEDMTAVAPRRWPALRFTVHPSVRRIDIQYETPALWKRHQAGEPVADALPAVAPAAWLLWRRGTETYFRSMAADEAAAFDRVLAGDAFAVVCGRLGGEDAALRAASLLKGWLAESLISGISD